MLNPWLWLGGMALVVTCLFSGYQYGKRVSDGEHALAMQDAIVKADAAVRAELDLAQSRVDALAEANAFHAARAAEARRRVAPKIVEISNAPPVPLDCKYDDLWVRIDSANSAINAETGGAAAPGGVRDGVPAASPTVPVGYELSGVSRAGPRSGAGLLPPAQHVR